MSSSHGEPHLVHLTLQKGPYGSYRKPDEDSRFGEAPQTITSRVISRHDSPSLRELDRSDLLQVDLGPQFGIDGSDFDLIFELDSQSPLSPFSDDQDDSDQSASTSTSYRHFPIFDSLSSLVDLDDEPDSTRSLSANSVSNEAYTNLHRYLHITNRFDFIRSIPDGQVECTSAFNEDFCDLSTGDVVFDMFFEELQRAIPGDVLFEFDAACLKELDARLLLAPTEAFEDICWAEISQPNDSSRWKPVPDVPASLVENGNVATEVWHMEYGYPLRSSYRRRLSSSSNVYHDWDSAEDAEDDCHPFAVDDGS